MSKAALKPRTVRELEARVLALQTQAVGANYPGATLTTRYVARLARSLVADLLNIDPALMILPDRGSRVVTFGRSLAIHLSHIVGGRRHDDVAAAFRRNRSTASHHFEVFENLREVPEFDAVLSNLEHKFALLLAAAEQRPYEAWGKALEAMALRVSEGSLEPDAHFDAKYVVATFKVQAPPCKG